MTEHQTYYVALFDSVSHVMKAEKILKAAGIAHKLIPVPRRISSDCGVCIRFLPEHRQDLEKALAGGVGIHSIQPL